MTYNILNYGAVADGVTVCSKNIQAAIDACAAAGGGRVTVPTGTFVTGTIWMKSNVELHLEHGAVLMASPDMNDYNAEDAYPQNFSYPPEEWVGRHLILVVECENVAITGSGTIDGSGDAFFDYENLHKVTDYIWTDGLALSKDKVALRPGQLLCFVESDHVSVRDIHIRNATSWCCFFHGCDYVSVRGIEVRNPSTAANTDGIDLDCCRYVTVSDCIVDTGDDAVAIRCSGQPLKHHEAVCEHITISNCVFYSASSSFRIGIGAGIIRHVRVSNIVIRRAGVGLHFMPTIHGYHHSDIEDVNFSGISAVNVNYPIDMSGTDASVKNVTLENIRMQCAAAACLQASDACEISGITLRNVELDVCAEQRTVDEEMIAQRGDTALLLKNVKDCRLENVRVRVAKDAPGWKNVYAEQECCGVEKRDCSFVQNA